MILARFLFHALGLDDGSGPWYLFWSGFFADVVIFSSAAFAVWGFWRRHNCHERGCWRWGRLPTSEGWVVCSQHHPTGAPHASELR